MLPPPARFDRITMRKKRSSAERLRGTAGAAALFISHIQRRHSLASPLVHLTYNRDIDQRAPVVAGSVVT